MPPESSPVELATVFAQLHGMFPSEEDATTAVQQVARAAHQHVPSATGAGVSLFDGAGTRVTTASTDTTVQAADDLQYRLGEGPCLSAWATTELQRIDDTAEDPRWARWQAAAAASGIRSALSTPLVHRGRCLGALKVYARAPGAFTAEEEKMLGLLADAAATLLGSVQTSEAPARLSSALKATLQSRETIALATGVLMAREHLDTETARASLLERARAQGRRVVEVAADVLATAHERRECSE